MKYVFINTTFKFRDGRYLHHPILELWANSVEEAGELLVLVVDNPSEWEPQPS